ncbi:hypothetical protein NECAME_04197 [Necator americanus]|uniref:Transcription initiation factor TFIID subunit 8 n=1 Tax=Necator americanus TaxID=51031 RepID=W2SWH2_NECAM|nr:hypothetical protein NECAME_04197 [Necator americanus]ETN73975.1 hypothetical protein NECAME_04197 [Necator americanus]
MLSSFFHSSRIAAIKLDTPESEFNEEIDAYANLLEDETVTLSPAAPVRPVPLGIEVKGDGDIPPEQWPEDDPYDQVIRQSVAAICSSVGFDAIDANMLELLAHRLKNSRDRQEPPILPPMLVGQSRPHPPYVHEFFPPFPEPHTYIHTEISGEPDLTYEAVRKTAAQRRREMERSLINYMMCMHAHTTLFPQFESKVRNEAKQYLRDLERERDFRKQRAEAIKAGIIENKYSERGGVDSDEDTESDKDEMVSDGDLEEVAETEMNMMLQRIPATCTVINPMPEARPYMSCMRSDEMKEKSFDDEDDEEDSEKKENGDETRGRTRSSASAGGDEGDSHGHAYDNPYLRIAQIQRKELKFLRESLESAS